MQLEIVLNSKSKSTAAAPWDVKFYANQPSLLESSFHRCCAFLCQVQSFPYISMKLQAINVTDYRSSAMKGEIWCKPFILIEIELPAVKPPCQSQSEDIDFPKVWEHTMLFAAFSDVPFFAF